MDRVVMTVETRLAGFQTPVERRTWRMIRTQVSLTELWAGIVRAQLARKAYALNVFRQSPTREIIPIPDGLFVAGCVRSVYS